MIIHFDDTKPRYCKECPLGKDAGTSIWCTIDLATKDRKEHCWDCKCVQCKGEAT